MSKVQRAIVGCEASQAVTKALRARGVEAFSCDLLSCYGGHPEWHFQEDIFEVLKRERFDLGIFHPPCTYLTVSASGWLKDQPERKSGTLVGVARREAQAEALDFVRRLMGLPIPLIGIENPISVISTHIRKPDQIIQPWMFGHMEQKQTCLWLKGLPKLKPTNNVYAEMMKLPKKERERIHHLPNTKDRWQIRSETFAGIAEAMSQQWSNTPLIQEWKQVQLF